MRTGGLPGGLAGLLGKLLGQPGKPGETKVDKQALTQDGKDPKAAGAPKGTALGPEGQVLAGLGYTPADKKAAQKNVAEQANIERFLQELPPETKGAETKAAEGEARFKDQHERAEPQQTRELREELRKDERFDEARLQAKEQKEQRETREAKESERERERDREREDEEEKRGHAWYDGEQEREEEEKPRRRGYREEDALGAEHRCRGSLDDGSRCLRKPMEGTPYCREHAAGWSDPR